MYNSGSLKSKCNETSMIWSPSTNTCFEKILVSKTFSDAQNQCMDSAPAGSRGRLAHIPSQEVYDLVYLAYGRVGMQLVAANKTDPFDESEWRWIEIRSGIQVQCTVTWSNNHYIEQNYEGCMDMRNGRFNDIPCNSSSGNPWLWLVCEYVDGKIHLIMCCFSVSNLLNSILR